MLFILSMLPFLYLTLLSSGGFAKLGNSLYNGNFEPLAPEITTPADVKVGNKFGKRNEAAAHPVYDQIIHPKISAQLVKSKTVTYQTESQQTPRQKAVVDACRHAWKGYKQWAWGKDELLPISKRSSTWFNLGLTLIDSLDTLYIMNMEQEFEEATKWVEKSFTADVSKDVNLFETTIRVLGGLLSAYNLSNRQSFLNKSIELGERLIPAFDSKSPIPYSDVNLHSQVGKQPKWGPDSSTSEVTTIQLEFKELSRLTGKAVFHDKALSVSEHIRTLSKTRGLVPYFINANTGMFRPGTLTLGARADSYYEYLFKQYLQTNFTETMFRDEFKTAVEGITALLTKETPSQHLMLVGELNRNSFSPKMDHLVCFYPGTLALASVNGFEPKEWYLELAANITRTCYNMYSSQPTGLAPEIAHFHMEKPQIPSSVLKTHKAAGPKRPEDFILDNAKRKPGELTARDEQNKQKMPNEQQPQQQQQADLVEESDIYVKPLDRHYLLRPETVESLFYMYRITGDRKYQEWGWNIFQSIEKYTKVPSGGYTSIGNVRDPNDLQPRDKMESFFIGETLKYLFLLFDDSRTLLPLDKFVFNTEAHPLPVFTPESSAKAN